MTNEATNSTPPVSAANPMTTHPTQERIAEIRARADAATPGPWTTQKPFVPLGEGFAPGMIIAAVGPKQGIYADPPSGSFPESDRKFIANARSDIPDLLLALDAAQEENRRLREALDGVLARYTRLVESGDAGFWDCETEDEVIAARSALKEPA